MCHFLLLVDEREEWERENGTKGRHLMSDSSHRILFFYSFTNVIVRHSLKCAVHIYLVILLTFLTTHEKIARPQQVWNGEDRKNVINFIRC